MESSAPSNQITKPGKYSFEDPRTKMRMHIDQTIWHMLVLNIIAILPNQSREFIDLNALGIKKAVQAYVRNFCFPNLQTTGNSK